MNSLITSLCSRCGKRRWKKFWPTQRAKDAFLLGCPAVAVCLIPFCLWKPPLGSLQSATEAPQPSCHAWGYCKRHVQTAETAGVSKRWLSINPLQVSQVQNTFYQCFSTGATGSLLKLLWQNWTCNGIAVRSVLCSCDSPPLFIA